MSAVEPSRSMLPSIAPRTAPATAPVGRNRAFCPVPKRYEETKPVVIQGHAHRMIIGMNNPPKMIMNQVQ